MLAITNFAIPAVSIFNLVTTIWKFVHDNPI